jgi:hypothetical protein
MLQLLGTYCNYNPKWTQYHVTIAMVFLCCYRLMDLAGLSLSRANNIKTYVSIPSSLDRHETLLFNV